MSQENELENLEAETQSLLSQLRAPVAKKKLTTEVKYSGKQQLKIFKNKRTVKTDAFTADGTNKTNRNNSKKGTFSRERERIYDTADNYLPNPNVKSLVEENKRLRSQENLLGQNHSQPPEVASSNGSEGTSTSAEEEVDNLRKVYKGPALQLPQLSLTGRADDRPLSASSVRSERSLGPLSVRSWNGFADMETEFDLEDEFNYNLGAPLARVNSVAVANVSEVPTSENHINEKSNSIISASSTPRTPRASTKEQVLMQARQRHTADKKNLPMVPSAATVLQLSAASSMSGPALRDTNSAPTALLNPEELKQASLLRNDGKALFLPDGSANINLRDTVRQALRVTRFDSVSTIMAHSTNVLKQNNSNNNQEGLGATRRKNNLGSVGNYELGPLRHKAKELLLAANFAGKNKKNKRSSKRSANIGSGDCKLDELGRPRSLRDVSYGGFTTSSVLGAENDASLLQQMKKPDNVCFGCWSSGQGNQCAMHKTAVNDGSMSGIQSMLICRNWNLGALRYNYRSEEKQEVDSANRASLRWDAERQRFVVTYVSKHAIYRASNGVMERYDHGYALLRKWRAWVRSLVEDIRLGRAGYRTNKPSLLRLRKTLLNNAGVVKFTIQITKDIPVAPTTATCDMSFNNDRVAMDPDFPTNLNRRLIVEVVPQPAMLFQARAYDMPKRVRKRIRSFFMAPPVPDVDIYEASQQNDSLPYEGRLMRAFRLKDTPAVAAIYAARRKHQEQNRRTYLRKISQELAKQVMGRALFRLDACRGDRFRQAKVVERTKAVKIDTEVFGEFYCKRGRGPTNITVGGLSRLACVAQLVLTFIPQQYGRYIVINKRIVAPTHYIAAEAKTLVGILFFE